MEHKYTSDQNYCNFKDHYLDASHNICNLKYGKPKEIPVVFHNESNFDYHYIIKELAKEFERKFSCFEENTKKNRKPFQCQQEKKLRGLIKMGKKTTKTISHVLQFFDSDI